MQTKIHLLQIVQARDAFRRGLGLGKRGQKQRRQNGDDCDDDQQFNERERGLQPIKWPLLIQLFQVAAHVETPT
jgi:hypothetical protein